MSRSNRQPRPYRPSIDPRSQVGRLENAVTGLKRRRNRVRSDAGRHQIDEKLTALEEELATARADYAATGHQPWLTDKTGRVANGAIGVLADAAKSGGSVVQMIADGRGEAAGQARDFYREQIRKAEEALADPDFPEAKRDLLEQYLPGWRAQLETLSRRADNLQHGQFLGTTAGQDPRRSALYRAGKDLEALGRETFPTDPGRDEDFSSAVANAAGQAGILLAGGGAGALLRAPAWFGSALLSAMSTGGDTVEKALESGESIDAAYTAMLLNAGMDFATEAIPVHRALNYIDDATDGLVTRIVKHGVKGGMEGLLDQVLASSTDALVQHKVLEKQRQNPGFPNDVGSAAAVGGALNVLNLFLGRRRLQPGVGAGRASAPVEIREPAVDGVSRGSQLPVTPSRSVPSVEGPGPLSRAQDRRRSLVEGALNDVLVDEAAMDAAIARERLRTMPDWKAVDPVERTRISGAMDLLHRHRNLDPLVQSTPAHLAQMITDREGQRTLVRLANGMPDQRAKDYLAQLG